MERILLMSLGSRGDMEPYLALGEELQQAGHEIAFCMPAQFESLAREVSDNFFPCTKAYLDLIEDPEVKKITGQVGSGLSRIRTLFKLLGDTKEIQIQLLRDQKAADDAFNPTKIIYHIKCGYPVMAALRKNKAVELLIPMPCLVHPVKDLPAIGMGQFNSPLWNRLSYALTNSALISKAIIGHGNAVIKEWKWEPLKKKEVKRFLLDEVPVQYPISQELFPRPKYWPVQVRVTGFRERNKVKHWAPSKELIDFLEAHPAPLYIGFGSMINAQPHEVGKAIIELSQELKLAILVNTSWGGIELDITPPKNVFVVSDIPYDWLFERVAAVIHHGGSGTTHSALRFNKPQLIIPHIADQFLWNKLIYKTRRGPLGFPVKRFSKTLLKEKIKELLQY